MVDVLALTPSRAKQARDLIARFEAETGSVIAAELLRDWATNNSRISLVLPRDYAKVLAAMEKAEREGLNVDEAVMEATRG
jgi:glutamate synthase (NADPH/NADH) large chain